MIGDGFIENSFAQYCQNAYGDNGKKSYLKAHYDVTGFCPGTEFLNGNILSRLRNALVAGINKQVLLPKAIIFVIENDILTALKHFKPGISLMIGKSLEWIMNQIHRIIITHKEKMPSKSRKFKYPTILWCSLPNHQYWIDNNMTEYRAKFNFALKATTSIFREMDVLELKWPMDTSGIFTNGKLNGKGLPLYWMAFNEAFESWDREQMKVAKATTPNVSSCGNKNRKVGSNNYMEQIGKEGKYKWMAEKTRFVLPKPKKF